MIPTYSRYFAALRGAVRCHGHAINPEKSKLPCHPAILVFAISTAVWTAALPTTALATKMTTAGSGDEIPMVHAIPPSRADSAVRDFDQPSYAFVNPLAQGSTPLVVYLPGTGASPSPTSVMGTFASRLGYRVLVLEYNNEPSISMVCPDDPDPRCSERFREMRTTGEGAFEAQHNPRAESIEARLRAALAFLDRQYPTEAWGQYLVDGEPNWSRMVLSGLSQGAGMAAYIAHRHVVHRVVLFSSPWDVTGVDKHPAPWLSEPSQTPASRWFAEYHENEKTARLISNAYQALGIPQKNIWVFRLDLPASAARQNDANPFHSITTRDRRYEPQWRLMFGDPWQGP